MNKILRTIKKSRTTKLDIYISEVFFDVYDKKLNKQTYYYNGNDDSLFFVEGDCAWMNLTIYKEISNILYEINSKTPFSFMKFINEKFNLNIGYVLTY